MWHNPPELKFPKWRNKSKKSSTSKISCLWAMHWIEKVVILHQGSWSRKSRDLSVVVINVNVTFPILSTTQKKNQTWFPPKLGWDRPWIRVALSKLSANGTHTYPALSTFGHVERGRISETYITIYLKKTNGPFALSHFRTLCSSLSTLRHHTFFWCVSRNNTCWHRGL